MVKSKSEHLYSPEFNQQMVELVRAGRTDPEALLPLNATDRAAIKSDKIGKEKKNIPALQL